MATLRAILSEQAPLLVLDAASMTVQVGVLQAEGSGRWSSSKEEAGLGLFQCLEDLDVKIEDLAGYLFCSGPGSILGIRTAASVLRAWTILRPLPIWSYQSLKLAVEAAEDPQVTVIADARRESWHVAQKGQGLRRLKTTELGSLKPLRIPEGFKTWSELPPLLDPSPLSYAVKDLLLACAGKDLFERTEAPEAWLSEEPSYATWTPQIHRSEKAQP